MNMETDARRFNASENSNSNISILMSDEVVAEIEEEYYKKDYENAGIALIFTHVEYEDSSIKVRYGADQDEENLKRTLGKYGFKVRVFRDYTTEKIENELKEVARENHSKNSAFIVVMMSHGDKDYFEGGIVHTFDGKIRVDSLWRYFAGDRCPSLLGKPKLFFIQACRGSLTDFGVELEDDEKRFNQIGNRCPQKIPIMADILVMFSSADGYFSIRDIRFGSWFIQALCLKLEQNLQSSKEKDLLTILTGVNRYVAYCKEASLPGDFSGTPTHKNMPVIMSMLTKNFKFDKKFFK